MEVRTGSSIHGREVLAEYLLLLLNPMQRGYKDPEGYKNLIGQWSGIPLPVPGVKPAPKAPRSAAIAEFHSVLRGLVDQWIDSGRLQMKKIGEQPWERSIRASVPGYPEPIERILQRFWAQHPPHVLPEGKDQLGIYLGVLRAGTWEQLGKKSPTELLQQSRDHAIEQFVLLLDSPSRHRLFRCDQCGTYFVKRRLPKREVAIARGTFCNRCKLTGNARRTENSRSRRIQRMVKMAADALMEWQPGNRYGEKKDWILKGANARLKLESLDPIKVNWISHHFAEIEKEVRKRKHAKG